MAGLDIVLIVNGVCFALNVLLYCAIYVRVAQLRKAPGAFVEYVDAPDNPPRLMPIEAWFLYFSRPRDPALWRMLIALRVARAVLLVSLLAWMVR